MKNAAGDKNCDEYIKKELEEAGIEYVEYEMFSDKSEVPSAVVGILDGWTFRRAWYYWVASSENTVLLFKYADELADKYNDVVRVAGHCGCPRPREWYSKPYNIGVPVYHVDTQEGLNALADAIRKQTKENNVQS